MQDIKDGNYQQCYSMVSEKYKLNLNLEDFTFKMKMLRNIAKDDEFFYYNTTFIGKTPQVELRILDGKKVINDIMPEFDFTLKSESDKKYKQNSIWLRFENENSDKIGVINFSYHTIINEETGVSKMSINPFIVGNYVTIFINNDNNLYVDVRGGGSWEQYHSQFRKNSNSILKKFTIEEIENLFKSINTNSYKFVLISEKQNIGNLVEIKALVEKYGYSDSDVFGYRSHIVENTQKVIDNYIASEPFPLKIKTVQNRVDAPPE